MFCIYSYNAHGNTKINNLSFLPPKRTGRRPVDNKYFHLHYSIFFAVAKFCGRGGEKGRGNSTEGVMFQLDLQTTVFKLLLTYFLESF